MMPRLSERARSRRAFSASDIGRQLHPCRPDAGMHIRTCTVNIVEVVSPDVPSLPNFQVPVAKEQRDANTCDSAMLRLLASRLSSFR